jgi:hypothetical protein
MIAVRRVGSVSVEELVDTYQVSGGNNPPGPSYFGREGIFAQNVWRSGEARADHLGYALLQIIG